MAYKFRMRKKLNISRVVAKIAATILALYVGGTIVTEIGTVMNGTASPFYKGLTLIGWGVGLGSASGCGGLSATADATRICNTGGSGILAVIGIIGIASIVMEFVEFRMGGQ